MPTIRRCCIVGCLSNSRQNPQLQFFQFPRPENPFNKLWKQACQASLSRILPFKKPVVCAHHFHPSCIGGRRLTASAVPSQRLEVPSNLKAVEQQAMVEEIERSRKCAYINAVVYEWLVRANLNAQLRGSITHGMIKEKADTAKQIIGSSTFVADNRWLNRFRETHLTGFAQKLATNQLKPLGPSLWIPDIVQDLQHLFPPTSADRVTDFENMPEQYIDYMQQYGEYEEDDEPDIKEEPYQDIKNNSYGSMKNNSFQDMKNNSYGSMKNNSYQDQIQGNHYQQHSYDAYGQQQNFSYNDYYYERQNQQQNNYGSSQVQQPQRPPSQSPLQHNNGSNRSSPYTLPAAKRQKTDQDDVEAPPTPNGNSNGDQIEDLTDGPDTEPVTKNDITKTNGSTTPNGDESTAASPKPSLNGQSNGHTSPALSTRELETYLQALEYLKPLEDFALFKENFRAIGLISQLEAILRKGDHPLTMSLGD